MNDKIKNWDKLKSVEEKKILIFWSKITTVTINDDGIWMLDMIPFPATPNAHMFKIKENE